MPDHLHMMWVGVQRESDQQNDMKFFRWYHKPVISPFAIQKQSYDNMLREKDRERDALQAACFYIMENPVRGGLVDAVAEWPL